jgi:outer membrane protein assembly factor BamB
VSDNGIVSCLDAKSGRRVWRKRLEGDFTASPVFAADRIHFLNETGTTCAVKPGSELELLARIS